MLIDDGHIDPYTTDTEHCIEPQGRMIIEAMIRSVMELALQGMPIPPLEGVMMHPVINAKILLGMVQPFQVFFERRQDIGVILLERGIIFPEPETDFQLNFIVGKPVVGIVDSGLSLGDE
jgi:hypothetical protein